MLAPMTVGPPERSSQQGGALRPLVELSEAACRALRGVVFDIDDTMTRGGRLEPDAYDALCRLTRAGLEAVAVTGRPLAWADVLSRLWPVAVAVGENGAGWTWRDQRGAMRCAHYDDDAARARYQPLFERVRAAVRDALPHVRETEDMSGRRCDLAFDVGERVSLPAREIAKLRALIEAAGARCVVSSVHAHAVPGDWDKARGSVRAVRDALDVDIEREPARWLFVGDSGNDAEAFAFFPLSVGVANVRDHLANLPRPPAFITDGARGQGFAELARHVLAARAEAPHG